MFTEDEFLNLTSVCRSTIITESIKQANNEEVHHSFQKIASEHRHLAIAARMTSKPMQWNYMIMDEQGNVTTSNLRAYTGLDIANIFINSVRSNGFCYYPIAGDWRRTGVQQLVLFVKNQGRYEAHARFKIEEIQLCDQMNIAQLRTLVDITPVYGARYKSVLKICNVETTNLPSNFIGIRSGKDLYDSAFKGSSSNVMMI